MDKHNKHILGGSEITADDFAVEDPGGEGFQWMEDLILVGEELPFEPQKAIGGFNISLRASCDVDDVFGTNVNTYENDDYLNIYCNLYPWLTEVEPKLYVTICKGDGTDEYCERPLNEREQAAILKIVLRSLPDYITSILLH